MFEVDLKKKKKKKKKSRNSRRLTVSAGKYTNINAILAR